MNRFLSGLVAVSFLVMASSLPNYSCISGTNNVAASSQVPYALSLLSLIDPSYDDSDQPVSTTYDYPAAAVYSLIPSGAAAISAGGDHDCVLMNSGGVKCWGENDFGGVGNGSINSRNDPIDVTGLSSGVQSVSAGGFHTCALMNSGTVKCWGLNKYGQLGDGTTDDRHAPVDVLNASRVISVSAGGNHTCLLMNNSQVWCFGRNRDGQLGDGSSDDKTQPVITSLGVSVKQVVTGIYHSCALANNGAVKCWGDNISSEIGDGTNTDQPTPVDVQRLAGVKEISSRSGFHTCALLESGAVKCWGWNGFGQLGDGTFKDRSTPVDVAGLSDVTSISAGAYHTCALLSSGKMKCWGKNTLGELANGAHETTTKPSDVMGISSVVAISAGGYAASPDVDDTCVLMDKGAVKCWGFALTDY